MKIDMLAFKRLVERLLPIVILGMMLVVAVMWLYGYLGVKMGYIGPLAVSDLNTISHHGAETAGGVMGAVGVEMRP